MKQQTGYLECEKPWVYWLLIMAAGWFGGYTFIQRGGVFCNAQTANIVLFGIALGQRNWQHAAFLLIPITAYFAGAFFSELLGKTVKRFRFLRWDTMLIGIEVLVVFVLGLLPARVPDQICQIALNFICSMQFNTFRQVEGIPAATTFVTNHIRQTGSNLVKAIRDKDPKADLRWKMHGSMILFFLAGGIFSTLLCEVFSVRAIWGSVPVLLYTFIRLMIADRTYERDLLAKVPRGHS